MSPSSADFAFFQPIVTILSSPNSRSAEVRCFRSEGSDCEEEDALGDCE